MSKELFDVEFPEPNTSLDRLSLTRFVPLKIKSEAELYKQESPEEAWRLNALRARMDNDSETPIETQPGEGDQRLISLKEIMLDTMPRQEEESHEAYIMLDEEMEIREDHVNS